MRSMLIQLYWGVFWFGLWAKFGEKKEKVASCKMDRVLEAVAVVFDIDRIVTAWWYGDWLGFYPSNPN